MDNIEKARIRLTDYISSTGLTQAVIAKKICLSTTVISQFLSDSYSGDNEEISVKINSFIDLQEMRTTYTKAPQFTDKIRNTRKIINTLDYVYANRCTGVVSGVSGSGKTTALKSYQKIMSRVIYIQADATKWSPCSILKLIAKSMNKECIGSSSSQKGGLRYAVNLFKVANSAEQGNISVDALMQAMQRVGKVEQF